LLTIAAITVGAPIAISMLRGVVAYRIRPVSFGFKYVDRATLRTIVNYSSVTLIVMVATQLKFKSDNVVIATMISASAVTYFSFGSLIVNYAQQVVMSLAQNFVPIASQSEATGNMERLRKVFVAGNRFCAFTALPITSVLLVLGRSVIEVWVGKKYVATSYPILVILIISATLMWCQAASGRVLFGISKHRTWAFVTLSEGIVNLLLSITLVHYFQRANHGPYYGIYGDALGTAIPLACTMTLFMPWHLCRSLESACARIFAKPTYSRSSSRRPGRSAAADATLVLPAHLWRAGGPLVDCGSRLRNWSALGCHHQAGIPCAGTRAERDGDCRCEWQGHSGRNLPRRRVGMEEREVPANLFFFRRAFNESSSNSGGHPARP
jgi:hypothetical protein